MTAAELRKELESLYHGAHAEDVRLKLAILNLLIKMAELDARLRALEAGAPRKG